MARTLDSLFVLPYRPSLAPAVSKRRLNNIRRRENAGSELYAGMEARSKAMGETNDCAVIAVAIVTGTPYERVHEIMRSHGRRKKAGVSLGPILKTLRSLGYRAPFRSQAVDQAIVEMRTQKNYRVRNLTTRQLAMFPELFRDWERCLVNTSSHILAMTDGKIHDFSEARTFHVTSVMDVMEL